MDPPLRQNRRFWISLHLYHSGGRLSTMTSLVVKFSSTMFTCSASVDFFFIFGFPHLCESQCVWTQRCGPVRSMLINITEQSSWLQVPSSYTEFLYRICTSQFKIISGHWCILRLFYYSPEFRLTLLVCQGWIQDFSKGGDYSLSDHQNM